MKTGTKINKVPNVRAKVKDMREKGMTVREIALSIRIHKKTVEYNIKKLKEMPDIRIYPDITNVDKVLPMSPSSAIKCNDWYAISGGRVARILSISDDMSTVTVSIHQNIASAREYLDDSNKAEFKYSFVRRLQKVANSKN